MIDLLVQTFRCSAIQTTTHLALMLAVARRCGDENGVCFAKQTTLATDTRLHPKTVGKAIGELEAMGLIRRVKGGVDDSGKRSTDHLYMTLPSVTLPRTGGKSEGSPGGIPGSPALPSQGVAASLAMESGTPHKETLEDTTEEQDALNARELSKGDQVERVIIDEAVSVIWLGVGDNGRKRSSKPKVKTALAAALNRRPKGVDEVDHLKAILQGVRAYLADPDTRKEGGRFEHGAHRTLVDDLWATYAAGGAAMPDTGAQILPPADPQLGTALEPGPVTQRLWAELAKQGMPWDPARGPRPGMPGCRISDALQREFGFTPWQALPVDEDDASAFA